MIPPKSPCLFFTIFNPSYTYGSHYGSKGCEFRLRLWFSLGFINWMQASAVDVIGLQFHVGLHKEFKSQMTCLHLALSLNNVVADLKSELLHSKSPIHRLRKVRRRVYLVPIMWWSAKRDHFVSKV